MHFIHVLVLAPEAIGSVNEDNVFLLVIDHFTYVVEVDVLKESENTEHVEGVAWSNN